ncbi:MAG: hypothetical protein H0T64_10140 [Pyrinomonadaceae bacterium]|jgi:predicted XRE-type DNA-binding protein|nr:hypothetical protein [Pyrinomonadaceae bacterium]MDQ3174623.1 helix-turn-helix domain-containing protein [Acidobacteriota bacterium]
MKAKVETVDTGSGNVFADLGFQDAEERLLKAKLATRIAQLLKRRAGAKLKLPNGRR